MAKIWPPRWHVAGLIGGAILLYGAARLADGWLTGDPLPDRLDEVEAVAGRRAGYRQAFADAGPRVAADARLQEFFGKVAAAGSPPDANRLLDLFDTARLSAEATADPLGGPPSGDGGEREVAGKLVAGMLRSFAAGPPLGAIRATEVRRVEVQPGGTACVVWARHRGRDGECVPARWWLTAGPAGWVAYDLEDCRLGWRLSEQVAPLVTGRGTAEEQASLQSALAAMAAARVAVAERRPADARELLGAASPAGLPPGHRVQWELTLAGIELAASDPDAALRHLDRADAVRPATPAADALRATALHRLGRWAEASAAATRYVELLGPDPRVSFVLVNSLRQQGYAAAADIALEAAQREFPDDAELRRLGGP